MAATVLNVQEVSLAGLGPTYSSATATEGDDFTNDGYTFLHVKNGGASPITVTITTPAKVHGVDVADITVSVPASGERMIGPFPPILFNDSAGRVHTVCSATTSVTLAAIRVKQKD